VYQMPTEVLTGERPGLFGLSLRQLMAVLLAVFLSANVAQSFLVQGVFAVVGIVLAKRTRGLYVMESLYYIARWWLASRVVQDDERTVVDPDRLYKSSRKERRGRTYVVRSPGGQVLTVTR